MLFQVRRREIAIAAVIGASTSWLLEWSPAASAAAGVFLVPLVTIVTNRVITRSPSLPAEATARGLCDCGHARSMHCGSDGAGPCAAPECRCEGSAGVAATQ